MGFDELVIKNRSYRGFDESYKVTRDELVKMISCARMTASTMNMQALKYCLCTEPELVNEIIGGVKFAAALSELKLPGEGKKPTAFIVICQDTNINENTNLFRIDVGIVAQTILLKAAEMGLGGCMMSTFQEAKLRENLSLPENIVPMLVVAIGKPEEEIVIVDAEEGGSIKYYRNEKGTHFVPKRNVEELILF